MQEAVNNRSITGLRAVHVGFNEPFTRLDHLLPKPAVERLAALGEILKLSSLQGLQVVDFTVSHCLSPLNVDRRLLAGSTPME